MTSGEGIAPAQGGPTRTSRTAATLSLPHTPHADEPADWAACRCPMSVAPATVIVTTLNSCSGSRSASVQ